MQSVRYVCGGARSGQKRTEGGTAVIRKLVTIGSLVVIGAGLGLMAYMDSRPRVVAEAQAAPRQTTDTPLILPEITIVGEVPSTSAGFASEESRSSANILER
jgi:hypothetical protein